MNGAFRGQYTLEFKQEAVRLVRGGESKSSVAKTLGISGQTLHNWVKAEAAGRLREVSDKSVSAEQMEIARLKAELSKTRMERDNLKKRRRILRESRGEIRLCRAASKSVADNDAMPGAERQRQWLSPISSAPDGGGRESDAETLLASGKAEGERDMGLAGSVAGPHRVLQE